MSYWYLCSFSTALLAEIREIFDNRSQEDDMLLSRVSGRRQPIVPHMEFDYPDPDIHEDLYQLIKYSCGEVCSSEQLDKVMKIWTTFLEPMLGVPSRPQGAEDTEDVQKARSDAVRTVNNIVRKSDGSPAGSSSVCKQSNASRNGDEKSPSERSASRNGDNEVKDGGSGDVAHKNDSLGNISQPEKMCNDGSVADATSEISKLVTLSEQLINADELERVNAENVSGTQILFFYWGAFLLSSSLCDIGN